jgi:hypothetical protein
MVSCHAVPNASAMALKGRLGALDVLKEETARTREKARICERERWGSARKSASDMDDMEMGAPWRKAARPRDGDRAVLELVELSSGGGDDVEHRARSLPRDDDVVEQRAPHEPRSLRHRPRERLVFSTGGGVTGWMVVNENERARGLS